MWARQWDSEWIIVSMNGGVKWSSLVGVRGSELSHDIYRARSRQLANADQYCMEIAGFEDTAKQSIRWPQHSRKTDHRTETAVFPQNRTETDRSRPVWNRNNTRTVHKFLKNFSNGRDPAKIYFTTRYSGWNVDAQLRFWVRKQSMQWNEWIRQNCHFITRHNSAFFTSTADNQRPLKCTKYL